MAGLASAAQRAEASVTLKLHLGQGDEFTRTCPATPDQCFEMHTTRPAEDRVLTFNGAEFCDSYCYSMSIFGNNVEFRGPLLTGFFGPRFTLTFDHDLGGVFPWDNAGFVSGRLSLENTFPKNPLGGRTIDYPILGFDISGLPGAPGVPEPATWAMLILGFSAVGVMMRRRTVSVSDRLAIASK